MLEAVLVFALLYLAVIFLEPLICWVYSPLLLVAKRFKSIAPLVLFLVETVSMGWAILGAEWLIGQIGWQSSIIAYGVVCLAFVWNGVGRISTARSGATPIRAQVEAGGSVYDAGLTVRNEIGMLLGDLAGFWGVYFVSHGYRPDNATLFAVPALMGAAAVWIRTLKGFDSPDLP